MFPELDADGRWRTPALSGIHSGAYEWTDLRRTVGDPAGRARFDETAIGRTLNHARVTVTGEALQPARVLEETRRALTAWDSELRRLLANKPQKKAAVLRMRRRS